MQMSEVSTLPAQTVVVVNGSTDVMGMLEDVLDDGRYDMVFVDASRAYSQVKRVQPNLVILCTGLEAFDNFRLLTMLKLDADTRDIPVLTYTTEYDGEDLRVATTPPDDDAALATTGRSIRMN
jgi:PleD family two-component response regulator